MNLFDALPTEPDKRVEHWPLMQSPWPSYSILFIYFLSIIFGRILMKNRAAFALNTFVLIYDAIQVLVCTYVTCEAAYIWIVEKYDFFCQPVDYSSRPNAIRAAAASWWFYIMKLVDLLDTIFFVLRKKNDQITFLHVYHHATMVVFSWWGMIYVAGGQSLFIAIINSFIHVIMYTYYGLSACGPKFRKYLWWKRYLTEAQILQFFIIITHSIVNFSTSCHFPKIFDVAFLI